MKLGKLPARPGAVKFKLIDYISLPVPPKTFGHYKLEKLPWGVLGNDIAGDCVLAGAGHETILWNTEAGRVVTITTSDAISDYSAITGYNPNDPSTDQGTDMQVAASYRRKTGIKAQDGRHKVLAYLALTPGNTNQLKQAIYLFSAVGVGFEFPDYAMDEFNKGQTWHVKAGGSIIGGHYVPAVGYDSRYVYTITWGKVQKMSWGFFRKYSDEGIAYLSSEMLTNNKSLENFDLVSLQSDLAGL